MGAGIQTVPAPQSVALRGVIPATSSLTVDTIKLSDFFGVVYEISLFNVSENKFSLRQLRGSRCDGTVKRNILGKLEDSLNFQFNFSEDGTDVTLAITNAELFPLNFRITKTPL